MPTPCVLGNESWLQPLVPCDEFQEPLPPPLRSGKPIWALGLPSAALRFPLAVPGSGSLLLVQLLHV